jgi:hypothetical protein
LIKWKNNLTSIDNCDIFAINLCYDNSKVRKFNYIVNTNLYKWPTIQLQWPHGIDSCFNAQMVLTIKLHTLHIIIAKFGKFENMLISFALELCQGAKYSKFIL